MERDAFALMAQAESDHWWFRGRRAVIEATLRHLALPADATLLDAGCGSGGNLSLLAQFGRVYGFEYDLEALARAQSRGIGTIERGRLPDDVALHAAPPFDVIGLFDVLEHLPEPVHSLRTLAARLAPTGAIVITVPAIPRLWGPHDEQHQHVRRYTKSILRDQLAEAGLRVQYLSGANLLLLPLATIQRLRERHFGYHPAALTHSPVINRLLYRIWRCELGWIPRRTLPTGLSLLAIARKADA